ncbi:hypothetical protein C8R46DRAFT_1272407 [Mycena filopes]|nr:hypothetical protein C8R46DRAFT_1272407 [Mycena filopes]
MGGAGPYIDYNLEEYEERCKHTGLSPLSEELLKTVQWPRARVWLMHSVRDVLTSDGWVLDEGDFHGEANYFYLIQVLLPGLISLVREEDYDDYGEDLTARILPSAEWIQDHRDILVDMLALLGEARVADISVAAADPTKAFQHLVFSRRYDDDSSEKDFTACSKELVVDPDGVKISKVSAYTTSVTRPASGEYRHKVSPETRKT